MDIGLFQNENGSFDICSNDLDVETDSGLRTAVIISLFTNARVDESELPRGETDLGGYWGDELSDDIGDNWGSKLWLLNRSKNSNSILKLAETYAADSLNWLKSDNIAKGISVSASFLNKITLQLDITIERKDGKDARYTEYWNFS